MNDSVSTNTIRSDATRQLKIYVLKIDNWQLGQKGRRKRIPVWDIKWIGGNRHVEIKVYEFIIYDGEFWLRKLQKKLRFQ